MNIDRFAVKFPAQATEAFDQVKLIPILHGWIRNKTLPGTLLDVVDYRHVPQGPGIMLITYEVNYALDEGDGELGLYAQQKVNQGHGSQSAAIEHVLRSTARFGALLEQEDSLGGSLKFQGDRFYFIANDRLHAPNSPEGFAALKGDLEAVAQAVYPGKSVTLTRINNDPRARLTVEVAIGESVSLESLCTS